jgi:hypothetical protein
MLAQFAYARGWPLVNMAKRRALIKQAPQLLPSIHGFKQDPDEQRRLG